MRWKERVERMLEGYCNNIKDPLERVCLKHDLFYPLAKLPEVVEEMVRQNYNPSVLCFRHLSKQELAKIEKDCTESLILSRALLSPLCMAGRVDLELKEVVSKRPSILQGLNPWTKSRLLHHIADDVWQNIFDALLDDPEMRKISRLLLQDFFTDGKNEKTPESSEPTLREKSSSGGEE